MLLKKIGCCISVFLLLICLFSCGKDVEKIEGYYHTEQYLEAANLAVDYYSDKKYRSQIDQFIAQSGSRLLRKAMEKAHQESLNFETDEGLVYITSFIAALESMHVLHFQIPELQRSIDEMKRLYDDRRIYFISVHYYRGIQCYEASCYQEALTHFSLVDVYAPDYLDIKKYKERAIKHAHRDIVLELFYQDQVSIKDYIKTELTGLSLDNKTRKENVVVQGLNVSRYFPRQIQRDATKVSSRYMTYISSEDEVNGKPYQYKITGKVTVKENDFTLNPVAEVRSDMVQALIDYDGLDVWETELLKYEVFTSGYKINIEVTVYILDNKTNEVLDQFTVSKTNGESFMYRGRIIQKPEDAKEIIYPNSYLHTMEAPLSINKRHIVDQTLERLSVEIAEKLKNVVDVDLDPISVKYGF